MWTPPPKCDGKGCQYKRESVEEYNAARRDRYDNRSRGSNDDAESTQSKGSSWVPVGGGCDAAGVFSDSAASSMTHQRRDPPNAKNVSPWGSTTWIKKQPVFPPSDGPTKWRLVMAGDTTRSISDHGEEHAEEAQFPQGLRLRTPKRSSQTDGMGASDMFEEVFGNEHADAAVNSPGTHWDHR